MLSERPPADTAKSVESPGSGELIGERYRVLDEIGRGGLAVIYRARDLQTGRDVALKRLLKQDRPGMGALFEREFHTLSQLSHPRIVAAYDYGVSAGGAYYTMELLDGGDVKSLAPLDFRRACALMRDVCSALCLLHSRRLVHRDISPRNIRCTTDGAAKLIDFGAMIAMGTSGQVVGTPPFCAPEVVELRALDARADLYSLGTTLYFTLTGRHVYPAPDFRQLQNLWQLTPPSPSQITPGIPRALDDLVMELIQLDARNRPAHAAVVMERLSAIAGLPVDEQLVVSKAYLSTPTLVGRERKLARARKLLARAKHGSGSSILVETAGGIGRTRFVDACALEAKLLGFTVVRASAADARAGSYGAARALATQLLDAHPDAARALARPHLAGLALVVPALRADDAAAPDADSLDAQQRTVAQRALQSWISELSARHPLAVVVDDADRVDEPSAALLAVLAHESNAHALAIVAGVQSGAEAGGALSLLRAASTTMRLGALKPADTQALLASMFGQVPHLDGLARRLHQMCGGNPRDLMHLAQHLVDRGIASYRAGSWTLPQAIDGADLPASLARAFEQRVEELSAPARELACTFALTANDSFALEECFALSAHDRQLTLSALNELVAVKVLRDDDQHYTLSQAGWIGPLLSRLAPAHAQALHTRVAELFGARGDDFRMGQHLLSAGREQQALDVLVAHARRTKEQTDRDQTVWARLQQTLPRDCNATYEAALQLCLQRAHPAAESHALRARMSSLLRVFGVDNREVLSAIVAQCKHDAGLDLYEQLEGVAEATRLQRALAAAQERYAAKPEHERVFAPLAALQQLGSATVETLGVVSVFYDMELWRSLPSLAPFRPLSASFDVLDHVRASVGERLAGRYERAHAGYGAALARLEQPDRAGLPDAYFYGLRDGVLFGRALLDSAMGSPAVLDVLDTLATGPFGLGAIWLRMLHCLWRGDGDSADHHRTELELARVQSNLGLDYEGGLLFTELCALACCDDLTRLRRIMPDVERWAKRVGSWLPMLHYARGSQRRMSGDHARALADMQEGLSLAAPGEHQLWPMLAGAEVQCLVELGQVAEAAEAGRRYQALARAHGIDYGAHCIAMPLSLALSALGEVAAARELAVSVVDYLTRQNSQGVPLGLAFHNLAAVSLAAQDEAGFRSAAERCAALFEHSSNQALATKYRRLMRARRTGQDATPGWVGDRDSEALQTYLTSMFETCSGVEERARVTAAVLAKHYQIDTVFVYVPSSDVATLVGAVGGHDPPPHLAEQLGDYLASVLGESVDATVTATATATGDRASRGLEPLWRNEEGRQLYPLVLAHHEPTGFVVTGVAVIALEKGTSFVHPGRVASALSRVTYEAERRGRS